MKTIKISEFVTEKGILLTPELLSKFKNQRVRIVISQIEEISEQNNLLNFAGSITNEDAEELTKNLDECRVIDAESWR